MKKNVLVFIICALVCIAIPVSICIRKNLETTTEMIWDDASGKHYAPDDPFLKLPLSQRMAGPATADVRIEDSPGYNPEEVQQIPELPKQNN